MLTLLTHRSASRTITQGRESPHLHAACRSRAGCVRCGSAQILSSMDQCINSPVETHNYIWEEAGGAAGGRDSHVWCSYPNLILAPILCYGIINELTILIITTVEVKICYSWNVDLIGSAVAWWRVSAIVLSQDVVEPSSNLRLRSKDCLLEVHQLVPYCSGLFNFDINTTLI